MKAMLHKLNSDEISYFCEQMSMTLNAGIPLVDGLEMLCEDTNDKKESTLFKAMLDCLNSGQSLTEAMDSSKAFPDYAIKMVKIGEITGKLETVLRGLSEYYESRAEIKRTVRTAVLHPLLLLIMMTAVIVVMIAVVLPMFGEIFSQFDSTVGETVQNAVHTAYNVGVVMLIVLLVIIILSLVVAVLSQIPSSKKKLSAFLSVFPFTRKMSKRFSMSKIADAFSMMVSAGISPEEMLELSATLVDDRELSQKLLDCRKKVLDGEYFADVISKSGIFPTMYAQSLKIAYNSGSVESAWNRIAEKCEESASETAAGIVSFIEPSIVIVLTTVIGAILLAVMIPLMNIMSVLG